MDFSFAEFGIIGIVALLVIGPDKLPGLARTAGLWVAKVKNFINSVKTEIDAEISMQDIKNSISSGKSGLHEITEIFSDTLNETRNEFQNSVNAVKSPNANLDTTPEYQVKAIPDDFDEDDEQHNDVEDDFVDDYNSDYDAKEIEAPGESSDFIATEGTFESSETSESADTLDEPEPSSVAEKITQTTENETTKSKSDKNLPSSKETM